MVPAFGGGGEALPMKTATRTVAMAMQNPSGQAFWESSSFDPTQAPYPHSGLRCTELYWRGQVKHFKASDDDTVPCLLIDSSISGKRGKRGGEHKST